MKIKCKECNKSFKVKELDHNINAELREMKFDGALYWRGELHVDIELCCPECGDPLLGGGIMPVIELGEQQC